MTDYLKSQLCNARVMDLTSYINSQGKAQYNQSGDVIAGAYEKNKDSDELVERLTNSVSIYVLEQSMGCMNYLRKESKLEVNYNCT